MSGKNVSDLLTKSLAGAHLEVLHLLALQAAYLQMPLCLVGGVVRDILLGRPVKDFDLVVVGDSATFAEYLVRKFGGKIIIHAKFGTATWSLNEATYARLNVPIPDLTASPLSFDLISARSETYSQPGALPTVKRAALEDDLRRRDFTINAMAIRLDGNYFGELYDPLGGQKDVDAKLIRVLHDRSFVDDPTRIFRAIRYAGRYRFEIEAGTQSLINTEALSVLTSLSGERLRHEFDLIFDEMHSLEMIADLDVYGVLRAVHPDLQFSHYRSTLNYQPTDQVADFTLPDILSFQQTLAWILWLAPLSERSIEAIARKLAFPTVLTQAVIAAYKLSLTPYHPGVSASQQTFYLDTFPTLAIYATWITANDETTSEILSKYLLEWRHVKPYTTGYTLQQHGLKPGPQFKEILTRLRAAWLDGEVQSEKEEVKLLNFILEGAR